MGSPLFETETRGVCKSYRKVAFVTPYEQRTAYDKDSSDWMKMPYSIILCSFLRVGHCGNTSAPCTSMAVHSSLGAIAAGFGDGSAAVFVGDLLKDKVVSRWY